MGRKRLRTRSFGDWPTQWVRTARNSEENIPPKVYVGKAKDNQTKSSREEVKGPGRDNLSRIRIVLEGHHSGNLNSRARKVRRKKNAKKNLEEKSTKWEKFPGGRIVGELQLRKEGPPKKKKHGSANQKREKVTKSRNID